MHRAFDAPILRLQDFPLDSKMSHPPAVEPPLCPPVSGPLVWSGEDISEEQYLLVLNNQEIHSVRAAVVHFKRMFLIAGFLIKATSA
jgi:hypothetical protein